jgi:protein-disulfide isomerase
VSKLSDEDLKAHASAVGLDMSKFNTCFDSRQFKSRVEQDMQDANDAGVSGTPAFFINGRSIEGAQPFEAFKEIIDDELSRR